MAFFLGKHFAAWRVNVLVGGLTANGPTRRTLDGARVRGAELIHTGTTRRRGAAET